MFVYFLNALLSEIDLIVPLFNTIELLPGTEIRCSVELSGYYNNDDNYTFIVN